MATRLTSAKLVEDLVGDIPNEFDELIDELIVRVSAKIEKKCGFHFPAANYTHHHDGNDREVLFLREGPINGVASVYDVTYGGTSPVETLVPATDYIVRGLRSEGWTLPGELVLVGSCWGCGRDRWKVTYNAGWVDSLDPAVANSIPQDLIHAATEAVATEYSLRDFRGLSDAQLGDYRIRQLTSEQIDSALDNAVAPYRCARF